MPTSPTPMKDFTPVKWLAALVLAILSLFLVAKTINTFAERDYIGKAVIDRDTITINGMGKVTATPDLALVTLGVYSDGSTVATVQQANTTKMNAIIAALKQMGIKDADIQTSNYSLQPKIDWSASTQRVIGYTLSQTVTVKVRDLTKAGDVLDTATKLGANDVGGVQFTIDDPSTLQDEARIKAIKDAQKKAEALANATGLHLIKVVSFSESTPGVPSPIMYDARQANLAPESAKTQIEAGSLDVNTNVSVTFEVR
ncbi:MAG: SIMPL domain-containing protein [Patescibacteria group bacterium]